MALKHSSIGNGTNIYKLPGCFVNLLVQTYVIRNAKKHTFVHVRPAKIQIRLRIRAVWSESSLGAVWIAKDAKFLTADNEDWADCAHAQTDLILRWAHM